MVLMRMSDQISTQLKTYVSDMLDSALHHHQQTLAAPGGPNTFLRHFMLFSP